MRNGAFLMHALFMCAAESDAGVQSFEPVVTVSTPLSPLSSNIAYLSGSHSGLQAFQDLLTRPEAISVSVEGGKSPSSSFQEDRHVALLHGGPIDLGGGQLALVDVSRVLCVDLVKQSLGFLDVYSVPCSKGVTLDLAYSGNRRLQFQRREIRSQQEAKIPQLGRCKD